VLATPKIVALAEEAAVAALAGSLPEGTTSVGHFDGVRLLADGAKLIVGGRSARGYAETLDEIGALYMSSLAEFRAHLKATRVYSRAQTRSVGQS